MDININFSNPAVTATIASLPWVTLIIYFFRHPDKVKIWGAIFLNFFKFLWKGKVSMERKVVKMDIEGRVNDFIQETIIKNVGSFLVKRVKINWAEEGEINTTKRDFIKNDQLIIQLRKSENQDENLVDAILLMISHCIVPNTRNYFSKSQKKAVDLYTASKFFEVEKPKVKSLFDDKFVCEFQKNPSIRELITKFIEIDDFGLFFPVLIQELQFLSQKTILEKSLQLIYKEVNDLIDFLLEFVKHRRNDECAQLSHVGQYCKCHILLVGIPSKMEQKGLTPYLNSINISRQSGVDTVYVISRADTHSKDFVSQIILEIKQDWSFKNEFHILGKRKNPEGKTITVKSLLVVLRQPEDSPRVESHTVASMANEDRYHRDLKQRKVDATVPQEEEA